MYKENKGYAFIGLEIKLDQKNSWFDKATKSMTKVKPSSASYTHQTDRPVWKDTFTNQKYFDFGYQKWTQTAHYRKAVADGLIETWASVDEDDDRDPKMEKTKRKFVVFFKKRNDTRKFSTFKQISESVPQYASVAMTEAQPSAPEKSQPVTMQDHKAMNDLDDAIPNTREPKEDDWDDQF